jgi:hypothetical protein
MQRLMYDSICPAYAFFKWCTWWKCIGMIELFLFCFYSSCFVCLLHCYRSRHYHSNRYTKLQIYTIVILANWSSMVAIFWCAGEVVVVASIPCTRDALCLEEKNTVFSTRNADFSQDSRVTRQGFLQRWSTQRWQALSPLLLTALACLLIINSMLHYR